MISIDGSYGEGGGQVLRTALALSAIFVRPVRIERIRAGRPKPGLAAQHLTAVRAMAELCRARLEGAELGSQTLSFFPAGPPQPGRYTFDVAAAREGGSAGSTTLVLQTSLLPLALAEGETHLTVRGGTHVAWSPPFHYLEMVYLPTLARMGIRATLELKRWGWYPLGGGEVVAEIRGPAKLRPLNLLERGQLKKLWGFSASSNLPPHIAQRQKKRAEQILHQFSPQIEIIEAASPGKGTAVFLLAEFEKIRAGFTAYGALGKPAEEVAEEACGEFLEYFSSGAAVDKHLADQLILPLAISGGPAAFSTEKITRHLLTNIWVVEQFTGRKIEVEGEEGEKGVVRFSGLFPEGSDG